MLNYFYAKLCAFNIEDENASKLPGYFQTLDNFISMANNQKITISGIEIDFFADIWEFKSLAKRTQSKTQFVYSFKDFLSTTNDYFDITLRLFLLYMLTTKNPAHTSSYGHFYNTKACLKRIFDLGVRNFRNLTLQNVVGVMNQSQWSYSTRTKHMLSLKYFLHVYSFMVEDVLTKEIYDYLCNINTSLIHAQQEQNKTPLLPDDFFELLHRVMANILDSQTSDIRTKMIAGLIIIGMQTGMRPSELTSLEKKSLRVLRNGDVMTGLIHYYSSKTGRLKELTNETIATPIAIDTFRKLIALDPSGKSPYIAFNKCNEKYSQEYLSASLRRICLMNCRVLGIVNTPNHIQFKSNVQVKDLSFEEFRYVVQQGDILLTDSISLPSFVQFRVYFASFWRAKGVGDREVSSMFGHLTYMMFGKYGRESNLIQDRKQQMELIEGIVNDEVTILGPKGKALQNKIEKFIRENNVNVETDISELLEKLLNVVEIRTKRGGFCIHSNLRRTCQIDSETDEFLCAYGCCPNHCHTYYSSPVTYNKFQDSIKVVEYNERSGFLRQVEKEMRKLKNLLLHELVPELNDIVLQVEKLSKNDIINRHPDTKDIIENLDDIYVEINSWLSKIEIVLTKIKED